MNPAEPCPGFFVRHPWLFVAFSFLLMAGAWSTLIVVAMTTAGR
jgi:hypothetical protein